MKEGRRKEEGRKEEGGGRKEIGGQWQGAVRGRGPLPRTQAEQPGPELHGKKG